MVYPFLKKLSTPLKCLMTYAVGQKFKLLDDVCSWLVLSVNNQTTYVICSIYTITVFPYFITLNCV